VASVITTHHLVKKKLVRATSEFFKKTLKA
jgi:hypothetical protein